MELAILGMGRMGKGIALRLKSKGHKVVCYNRSTDVFPELQQAGCITTNDAHTIKNSLQSPRVVWIMLPSGAVTEEFFTLMLNELSFGDIIIDGGNIHYTKTLEKAARAKEKKIQFIDVGVSGGLGGAHNGYCTMVGGEQKIVEHCESIFKDMSMEGGYAYMGPSGSGHYVKMVHNAIEYAQMQAIGEGFDVLANGHYKGQLDFPKIAKLWNHGSIIRGYLMECTEDALTKDPNLDQITDFIEDNGEGKWTVQEALDHDVPFLSGAHAVFSRYISRQKESFAYKIVAAQRNEFGGHKVMKK